MRFLGRNAQMPSQGLVSSPHPAQGSSSASEDVTAGGLSFWMMTWTHSVPFSTVGADTPTACCFSYVARQIQRKFIADYFETSSQCSQPGVM